jgi:DNA-binding NarL/FixJ family response regulator
MPTNAPPAPRPLQSSPGVRVLIVAAVRLYREGMASCLDKRDELAVVGTAATCDAALDRAVALAPDIVLLDTAIDRGVELVRALREATPPVKTVLFAVENDERAIIACAEAGAAGYLPSDASLDDLAAALVGAARGELLCPPMVAAALMRHVGAGAAAPREHPALVGLTSRERDVLALIDAGLSNKEIAVRLHIEVATVKNHVHHLLDKLKVTSRGAAAARLGARQLLRRSAR